jgi:hypothetical protein
MEKWSNDKLEFDRDLLKDAYYLFSVYQRYTTDRSLNNLNKVIDIIKIKLMRGLKEGKYNGQTKSEFDKNYKRVKDIVDKAAGSKERAAVLAQTQANRITDEWKAINRAMAAKQTSYLNNTELEVYDSIFESFFQRAYELGSVSKQDYRNYKLEKLGI